MLLLIDNYDSFTYNLAQYFGELGEEVRVVRNDAIDLAGIAALGPARKRVPDTGEECAIVRYAAELTSVFWRRGRVCVIAEAGSSIRSTASTTVRCIAPTSAVTRPPAPRRASSSPSSLRSNVAGPRFEATTRGASSRLTSRGPSGGGSPRSRAARSRAPVPAG